MSKKEIAQLFKTIFIIFILFPLFTSCESRKTIVNGLDEREANEIWVFLSSRGIDVAKIQSAEGQGGGGRKEVTWDISVRSDQAYEALALLNQAGLPRSRGQSLLSIFKEGSSLVPSEMQEKVKFQAGTAAQIANTLRKIDGILDAEVQISFPEENPLNFNKPKEPITASVFIKHNGVLDDPNLHLESKIKRLVSASVPGLDYDSVTVVGSRAQMSEYGIGAQNQLTEEEKPYVHVWSIIMAKESVGTFRAIFFSFIIFILLLLSLLIWTGWKLYPLLQKHGGLRSLFSMQPIEMEGAKHEEEEKHEEGGEESEPDKGKKEDKGPPSEVT